MRPKSAMAEFKLSLRAEAKLTDIYAFTEIRFGRYQADTRGLNRRSICWLILRALVLNHIFYTEESYGC